MITRMYYAVLKYIPDVARGEYLNVGLVLVGPRFAGVRVTDDPFRLTSLNPKEDPILLEYLAVHFKSKEELIREDVQHIKEGSEGLDDVLASIMRSLDHEYNFLVQLGELRTAEIEEYSEYKAGELMDSLFDRLVGFRGEAASRKRLDESTKRFKTQVKESFRSMHLLGEEKAKPVQGRVVEFFPIPVDHQIDWFWTDFGYRNGHDVLIDTIDFDSKDLREGVHRAAVTAVKFDLVRQHLRKEGKEPECIALVKLGEENLQKSERQLYLLSSYSNKIFNLTKSEQMSEFFGKVEMDLGKSFV